MKSLFSIKIQRYVEKNMLTPSWNIDHVYKIKNSNAMSTDEKSLMWISLAMVKNKHKRNWVVIELKAWRWTKTNKRFTKGITFVGTHGYG